MGQSELATLAQLKSRFAADRRNFSLHNSSEAVVLESNFFSGYKGRLVVRLAGLGGRSFSMGTLFIKPGLDRDKPSDINVVKHEYGHAVQLNQLGLASYIWRIGIPSVSSKQTGREYYDQLWEVTADVLGGVDPEVRAHSAAAIQKGMDYLSSNSISSGTGKTP